MEGGKETKDKEQTRAKIHLTTIKNHPAGATAI